MNDFLKPIFLINKKSFITRDMFLNHQILPVFWCNLAPSFDSKWLILAYI